LLVLLSLAAFLPGTYGKSHSSGLGGSHSSGFGGSQLSAGSLASRFSTDSWTPGLRARHNATSKFGALRSKYNLSANGRRYQPSKHPHGDQAWANNWRGVMEKYRVKRDAKLKAKGSETIVRPAFSARPASAATPERSAQASSSKAPSASLGRWRSGGSSLSAHSLSSRTHTLSSRWSRGLPGDKTRSPALFGRRNVHRATGTAKNATSSNTSSAVKGHESTKRKERAELIKRLAALEAEGV